MTMLAPRTDRQQSLHPTPETALVMGRNTTGKWFGIVEYPNTSSEPRTQLSIIVSTKSS
jgi:hypothetical protein